MEKLPDLNKQTINYINATPDEGYILRILQAYRNNCDCKWVSNVDNPLIQEMNMLQDKRAKLLDEAIHILKIKMNFNEYQEKVKDTWISNEKDLDRMVLGICGEAGEMAEYFKKFYRQDLSNNPVLDYTKIRSELGDILYYVAMLCNELGMKLIDVANCNIIKLQDRKKRNKIKGSGDSR